MFDYYCKTCKKFCDFDEEIELREVEYEGDWQEYHIECDSKVAVRINVTN